jgi:polysaccharide pyruvyl transferase WcaK-like protein
VANVQHTHILKQSYTSRQMRGLVTHLEFVIGMRLHFLIFTALAGVPFVPLSYGSKVAEFISELTMPMPPVQATNAGQLLAYIDHAWDYREELRQRIATHLPALIERATHTAELAVRLVHASAAPNHSTG